MKLKLDLHPIYSDTVKIEHALQAIIDEAVEKHATEVEIIPGKGSGALKKSVLRFLNRPEIKARYHRIDKDSDNWGRLFVYFRHERPEPVRSKSNSVTPMITAACACCGDEVTVPEPNDEYSQPGHIDCPWCGSPNRISFRFDRSGQVRGSAELDYLES